MLENQIDKLEEKFVGEGTLSEKDIFLLIETCKSLNDKVHSANFIDISEQNPPKDCDLLFKVKFEFNFMDDDDDDEFMYKVGYVNHKGFFIENDGMAIETDSYIKVVGWMYLQKKP